jgi:hypothetical protein
VNMAEDSPSPPTGIYIVSPIFCLGVCVAAHLPGWTPPLGGFAPVSWPGLRNHDGPGLVVVDESQIGVAFLRDILDRNVFAKLILNGNTFVLAAPSRHSALLDDLVSDIDLLRKSSAFETSSPSVSCAPPRPPKCRDGCPTRTPDAIVSTSPATSPTPAARRLRGFGPNR